MKIPKTRIPKFGEIIETLSKNYLIWKSFPELLTSSIEPANSWRGIKLPNYAYTKDKDSRIVGLFYGERLSIPPESYEKYVKVANKLDFEEVPVSLKVVNIPNVMKSFVDCSTYRNLFDQAF